MARFRALPYAKALYEVISKNEPARIDEVSSELDRIAAAIAEVPQFLRVLTTPMVSPETKTTILNAVLDSLEIGGLTRQFLHVVQRHFRMEHMASIAEVYREIADRAMGRTRASIAVAGHIDEGGRRSILSTMNEVVGGEVVADFVEKPELLAGFRIQIGSKVYDGSLVGQVDRLSREMLRE
jgi:F-type H+-transporting ATPase subunit delta